MRIPLRAILSLAGLSIAAGGFADPQGHAGHALGKVDFPVSCSARAQADFNRAMALLHHMTYPQAQQAFERIARDEPRCAMAHWGVAMTLFQPLWPTRPDAEAMRRGRQAVEKARALAPPTERERLLVDAGEAFFGAPDSLGYWQRIARWEKAMQKAHAALPQDPEATALYALAHLAVAPADAASHAHGDRAARLLLTVYERNPDHPGAMHYLVHANDMPGREHELLEIVAKYETVAPRNPHALHMPTHIYTRLGKWDAVIRGNLRAAEAALEHPAGDQGQYVWDEFPHAIEYLVYAHLQQGADEEAAAQLQRLRETRRLEPTFKTAFHLSSIAARHALERRDWKQASGLAARTPATLDWDRFPWPEAITWFARGLGAARLGELESARAAVKRLAELETAAERSGEELFTRHTRVLRLATAAWLAHAEQHADAALRLMREAAELEASTPKHAVTPGPTLPAHEQLGDLLLERRRAADARAAYERSLELYPNRFNSVLGAARAARASGDATAARAFYERLIELAGRGGRSAALEEARAFTGVQP